MKKTNPRRKPATAADVAKAKKAAQEAAIAHVFALFFTVMRDKEGYGEKRLRRLWARVIALARGVEEGYVDVRDLMRTLEEEAGVRLSDLGKGSTT